MIITVTVLRMFHGAQYFERFLSNFYLYSTYVRTYLRKSNMANYTVTAINFNPFSLSFLIAEDASTADVLQPALVWCPYSRRDLG